MCNAYETQKSREARQSEPLTRTQNAWGRYRSTARGRLAAILPAQQVRQLHDFTMVAAAPRS